MTPHVLGERLGGGAVTDAFVATSFGAEGFEKTVVVKRVHADLAAVPTFVDALLAGAHRVSALSHANVVLLMDVARDAAGLHLVTEYVEGVDLARLVDLARAANVQLSDAMVAFIGAEIAKGLDYAHRRRGGAVVHGGLSPHNVLLSRDGAVKISDFGVHVAREDARFAPDEVRARPFRAPERLDGGEATKAADVYALGAILRGIAPSFDLVENLLGPADARPTAGEFHERVLAWAYQRGGIGHAAADLAKLVARLRTDVASTATVDAEAIGPAPTPTSADGARREVSAKVREVVLFVATDLDAADAAPSADAVHARDVVAAAGGTVLSEDRAEVRAVFGLASEAGRDVRDALRAALDLARRAPRLGVAIGLGRALVDERGEVVHDDGAIARFSGVAALAHASRGRAFVTADVVRVASNQFVFGADAGRAFVERERDRPLATTRFVGRRPELARLGARWAESRKGSPSVVALTGPPGSGKTRLALEMERVAKLREPTARATYVATPSDPWEAADLVIVDVFDGVAPRLEAAVRAARGVSSRTLVIVVTRELDDALRAIVDEEIALGPLDDDDLDELAATLLGARVLTPELVDELRQLGERSPLFVTETVRDWLDEAAVVVRDGVAVLHGVSSAPPRTLRALVEARLEKLGEEERAIVRAAAIAGEDVTAEEISAMTGATVDTARDVLLRTSPVVRRVALETVPMSDRAALHASAERALLAEVRGPAARRDERIATHRLAQGDARGAREAFSRAADAYGRPVDRGRAAARALGAWADVHEGPGPSRDAALATLPRLVGMLAAAAEHGAAVDAWLDLARDAFDRVDRDGALADRVIVRLEAARLGVHLAAVPEARVALDQASNLAVDRRLRARVLATEIELALRTGEIARGRDAASALLDLREVSPRGARLDADAALRELESPTVLADAAEIFGASRDERAAETALSLALDLGADASAAVRAAIEVRRARVELALGRAAHALRTSVIAVDLADAIGATRLRAEAKLTLAESSIRTGRLDRAYAALVSALEASESSAHTRVAALASARLAWLDAPADLETARTTLQTLASRADGRGFASDALAIRIWSARLLEGEPARTALAAAAEAATRLGHHALAAEARDDEPR